MDCDHFQENLSNYIDRNLPPLEMSQAAGHLAQCNNCSTLLDAVRATLISCKTMPALNPGGSLVERILLRTSGRPRRRTVREIVTQYVFRPMFTPRFAAGAALAALTFVFAMNWVVPPASALTATLSPGEILRQMDRGVQRIYGEGLKAYDKKNELQAEFTFFKDNVFKKVGFLIEQLDVPDEGNQDSEDPGQEQKPSKDKSSVLLLPV